MEIIKIDAEIDELPDTGVRYFAYVKIKEIPTNPSYWSYVYGSNNNPWFISQDEAIQHVLNTEDKDRIDSVLILKAELPIKKLVLGNG